MKLEECIRKQEMQITSIKEERDNLNRIADELKMDLRLKEDKVEGINNELQDALRKTKEGSISFFFYLKRTNFLSTIAFR